MEINFARVAFVFCAGAVMTQMINCYENYKWTFQDHFECRFFQENK